MTTPPMNIIARIHSDFPTKFGIPRQSGLVDDLEALVVFEAEYRNPDALRGIEGFSHLWLIWLFHQAAVERHAEFGTVLRVAGADLMDGTPILDIKPYLPYADCHPEAIGGFAADGGKTLEVHLPDHLRGQVPNEKRAALVGVLSRDPRPSYQRDPERIYGMDFAGYNIRFSVDGGVLTVREITPLPAPQEKERP